MPPSETFCCAVGRGETITPPQPGGPERGRTRRAPGPAYGDSRAKRGLRLRSATPPRARSRPSHRALTPPPSRGRLLRAPWKPGAAAHRPHDSARHMPGRTENRACRTAPPPHHPPPAQTRRTLRTSAFLRPRSPLRRADAARLNSVRLPLRTRTRTYADFARPPQHPADAAERDTAPGHAPLRAQPPRGLPRTPPRARTPHALRPGGRAAREPEREQRIRTAPAREIGGRPPPARHGREVSGRPRPARGPKGAVTAPATSARASR